MRCSGSAGQRRVKRVQMAMPMPGYLLHSTPSDGLLPPMPAVQPATKSILHGIAGIAVACCCMLLMPRADVMPGLGCRVPCLQIGCFLQG